MDSTEQRGATARRGLDGLSTLGQLGLKVISWRLGIFAIVLMCVCGAAAAAPFASW